LWAAALRTLFPASLEISDTREELLPFLGVTAGGRSEDGGRWLYMGHHNLAVSQQQWRRGVARRNHRFSLKWQRQGGA